MTQLLHGYRTDGFFDEVVAEDGDDPILSNVATNLPGATHVGIVVECILTDPTNDQHVAEQRHELEVEGSMRRFTLAPLGGSGLAGQQQQ